MSTAVETRSWEGAKKVLAIVFFIATSLISSSYIGYLFGWVCGSSMTPVVATIAPLILGLLTGLGMTAGTLFHTAPASTLDRLPAFVALGDRDKSKIKSELSNTPNYWQLGWAAVLLYAFGVCCYWGLRVGGEAREDPFPSMGDAMAHWPEAEIEIRTAVYDLRWRMQKSGMGGTEFWNFAIEVIDPILASELTNEQKLSKLIELTDTVPKPPSRAVSRAGG